MGAVPTNRHVVKQKVQQEIKNLESKKNEDDQQQLKQLQKTLEMLIHDENQIDAVQKQAKTDKVETDETYKIPSTPEEMEKLILDLQKPDSSFGKIVSGAMKAYRHVSKTVLVNPDEKAKVATSGQQQRKVAGRRKRLQFCESKFGKFITRAKNLK